MIGALEGVDHRLRRAEPAATAVDTRRFIVGGRRVVDQTVILNRPQPFAAGLAGESEQIGRRRFAVGVGSVVGAVERFEIVDALGERRGDLRTACGLLPQPPVQRDARFEGVGGHTADARRTVGARIPLHGQVIEQVVVEILQQPRGHLLARDTRIVGVIVQIELVVDEGDVAVELAPQVVVIGADTEQLGFDLVEPVFGDDAPQSVQIVQHQMHAAGDFVDRLVYLLAHRVVGRQRRAHRLDLIACTRTVGADVADAVVDPHGEGGLLDRHVRQPLVGGVKPCHRLLLARGERSRRGAVERFVIQRAARQQQTARYDQIDYFL